MFFDTTVWTWFPVATLLVLLPVMCYQDWKHRSVSTSLFVWYAVFNLPVIAWQYYTGIYGWEEAIITGFSCVIYYAIMRVTGDFFHGDDMLVLWCVSIFCIVNPLKPDSGSLGITTLIYLIPVMFTAFCIAMIPTMVERMKAGTQKSSIVDDVLRCGGKFPLVIPISVAFVLAVVL